MNITEIVRRSSLIMPVNQPRFVERAYLRGADAIVLDLEDSVPPAEKGRARASPPSGQAQKIWRSTSASRRRSRARSCCISSYV
jgi:citrate lyase beta subunit